MDVEGSASDNGIAGDDPIDHWKKCEESQRKRMKVMEEEKEKLQKEIEESQRNRMQLMEEEKEKLQKEIDTMNSVIAAAAAANISGDDIIEINAGGKIISALRSTLTSAPDTVLSYMFSGRWEESLKRDSNGRVFIDENPQLIEIIIDFLRMKKKENPSKPTQSPKIPEEKKEQFSLLLDYFGLTDFFYPPSSLCPLDIDNMDIVQPHSSLVNVTKSENKIQLLKNGNNAHCFVACKPPLDSSGEGSFWKVTIDASPAAWLCLGIIGNLGASNTSYADSTSYGWASSSQVYHGGTNRSGDDGWTNFAQGECLYFHLKANKLTMFSVQKDKKFTIDVSITVGAYYIHCNTHHAGTKWKLEPLSGEERERFL